MEQDDELSLVDLTIIFLKRRYYFLAGFFVVLVISFSIVYLKHSGNKELVYESVFRVSSIENRMVSNSAELIAGIYGEFYYEKIFDNEELDYLMKLTTIFQPHNSMIIKLETKGSNEGVEAFHEALLSYIKKNDNENLLREERKLNKELSKLESLMKVRSNSIELKDEVEFIKEKLDTIKSGEVLVKSHEKPTQNNNNSLKFYFVALVISVMGGFFTVVLVEFISAIRNRLESIVKK